MEQVKISTKIAGIDVSKARLDVAAHGSDETAQFANTAEGFTTWNGKRYPLSCRK